MSWTYTCKPQESHFNFKIFNSIADVKSEDWNSVLNGYNIYLSLAYLKAMEDSNIERVDFKYAIFFDDKVPVGIAYFQLLELAKFEAEEDSLIEKIGAKIKNVFLDSLSFRILVGGNIFTTGENSFYFKETINKKIAFDNISNILFQIRTTENKNNTPSIVLLKEFWPESFNYADNLLNYDFRSFEIDVNMVLNINKDWNTIEDYLASMTTKFRTKAKGCFKKSKDVIARNFTLEDVNINGGRILELYNNVVDHADFQLSKFNANTFINLKEQLGDNFIITGYYLEDKLIGFKTAYINGEILDAGYVGLDYEYNHKYAVYQKILYSFVEIAINHKLSKVNYGRTAEEIKSTLGAEPVPMKLFMRHKNSLSNKIIKPMVKSIAPSEFSIRKPFKQA